ncbi:cation/calcium exchanger 1-like [Oryza glaberrima]|uniref:Sodium/calcium exchanger membrane region domain-containing protein n=1 Tax=Oryza glaberrima TaxID=4538 RepID=I1R808_ORYGL|nr:cation/calcium exchanger 1-like [Oryza glaberrima]
MAAFLRTLHRRRTRNAAAAAFLALAVVVVFFLSVFVATRNEADIFFSGVAAASSSSPDSSSGGCRELQALDGDGARCRYLRAHAPCAPVGYVDYLRLLYCGFGRAPWLGYAALALWLLVLFYLLGDTASAYFCASLEGLSAVLRLPPAIAGVTLLSLGNGAPDVLSSVVAFAAGARGGDGGGGGGEDAGDVGLSGVLGGALFVSTVVAGVVAIVAGRRGGGEPVIIERRGFVRDVCFLLVALCYLLAVLLTGAVTVWSAASFLSLYAGYVLLVWTSHCCATASDELEVDDTKQPTSDLAAPLLVVDDDDASPPPLPVSSSSKPTSAPRTFARRLVDLLHSPLYLPRRLTIPDIAAHRWSKPTAVATALLSPLLLAATTAPTTTATTLLAATLAGALLATAAAATTDAASPPKSRSARLPWLAGGFLMSVLWSYVLARELVALLVSIGVAAGVEAGVLGATVLAWGNSLGDLVADVALATRRRDGGAGAQTAVAGCYAAPAFNTVVGLGLSLTVAAGARHPEAYAVEGGAAVYVAVGFLAAALVWAVAVLPARGMRLDAVLGVGLLVIYFVFLCVSLAILTPLPSPH